MVRIVQHLNDFAFTDLFREYNREENFTVPARRALFDYLEQEEKDLDIDHDVDVIALCCAFTEFQSVDEINDAYAMELDDDLEQLKEHFVIVIPVEADEYNQFPNTHYLISESGI